MTHQVTYKKGVWHMLDVNALRAEIKRNGYTEYQVAEKLGISAKTFSLKLKKGKFNTDEASLMVKLLKIKDPSSIFFASKIT